MSPDNEYMEYSEDDLRNRVALHEKLRKISGNTKPKNTFACEVLELSDMILKCADHKETPDPEDKVRLARYSQPPTREIFTDELFASPLFPIAFINDFMKFYDADPVTEPCISSLMIPLEFLSNYNVMTLGWI